MSAPRRTLEEVRQLFPLAKYAPRQDCKYCAGSGENLKHPGYPCICAFVAHDLCDIAADGLAKIAREGLAELRAERAGRKA